MALLDLNELTSTVIIQLYMQPIKFNYKWLSITFFEKMIANNSCLKCHIHYTFKVENNAIAVIIALQLTAH